MKRTHFGWKTLSLTAACLAMTSLTLLGAEKKPRLKLGQYNPEHETIELFAGMDSGEIEVKFIPRDSTEAQVIIHNKTDKPLNVKLPAAFAGVPVLAQFGGGGMGGGGMGGGGMGGMGGMGGGGNQAGGGGMGGMGGGGMGGGGMGGGGMGGGGGGGFFNVRAEKIGKFKVPFMCLEHGKKEPRPGVPYKIIPIAQFTKNTAVHQLCTMLGEQSMSQRSAQVAAWHLANDMSFEELAAKKIEHLDGSSEMFFTQQEVREGQRLASQAIADAPAAEAESTAAVASPGQEAAAKEDAKEE